MGATTDLGSTGGEGAVGPSILQLLLSGPEYCQKNDLFNACRSKIGMVPSTSGVAELLASWVDLNALHEFEKGAKFGRTL